MKINQEESIKLYLRIKPPQIIDEPYYSIDKEKSIFSLKSRGHIKNNENILNLNLNKIFTEDDSSNDIYYKTCQNVIKESLNGCSFCFINHGETISDKLNTLMGDIENNDINNNNKGIFQNLTLELINYIEQNKKYRNNINLEFSFCCVYESKVIDLNNYLGKDISNINLDDILNNSKLIQNDKSLINSFKKIPLFNSNISTILYHITNIINHFKKTNPEFFSNSYFSPILYLTKKITQKESKPISSITFILLNGSEKLNIIENIKLDKNKSATSSDIKKQAIAASKNSISTQNNYNSIIYLIKQNKMLNVKRNKNKEKLSEEEIREIKINEGRYISNLTAILYEICFDYNIENIKYYIFANIFPNIGYYKSIKDTALFLLDLSKIFNKNIKDKINKNKFDDLLENKFLFDLETKLIQQEQTISALSEICQSKNNKIDNLENEYNSQINKLKSILGFKGDIHVLLSGDNSPEMQKAKNMRESSNRIKMLNSKIKSIEQMLKKSEEEMNICKSNEDIMKNDINMIKYFDGINSVKNDKLNEMKMKSLFGQKLNMVEKELKKKNIIINELKKDLENKNNIIQNFSKFSQKKTNQTNEEEKKVEEKINKVSENIPIKDTKEIQIEKLIQEYEKKLKDEKDFWISTIESKESQIKEIKNQLINYKLKQKEGERAIKQNKEEIEMLNKEIINNKKEKKYNDKELMKLNEVLMDIIYKYNSYFIHKSQNDKNFIELKNKIEEFNIYITEKEKEINQVNFPTLHVLLEKNNKLSTNYKIKSEKNIKINKKETNTNINNKNENVKNNIDNNINIYNKYPERLLTKEHLEKMEKNKLIDYCLTLNQRIIDVEKYTERFQEIKLENEESKKQIIYLKFKLKRVISEAEKINEMNNNNKIVINSQNRAIERFKQDKLIELNINTKNTIENFGMHLSPKKKALHFNKSQANLKTYNSSINYNEGYNKNKNRNKNYKIFLKNKTENNGITNKINKNLKEIQIPFNYFGLSSNNQTIDTNNYVNDGSLSIKSDKNRNIKKNMFKNKFSASYTNFYSQN